MVEDKTAVWICQKEGCGTETPQPSGNEPIVAACPVCGTEHTHLREPDGIVTEFVDAPDFFIEEFNERMKEMQEKDQALMKAVAQEMSLRYDVIPELREKAKNAGQRQSTGLEQALRRTQDKKGVKLSKRQDFKWMYHPGIKKFSGRNVVDMAPKPGVV